MLNVGLDFVSAKLIIINYLLNNLFFEKLQLLSRYRLITLINP